MSRKKLRKALKDPNTVHQVRLSDGRVVGTGEPSFLLKNQATGRCIDDSFAYGLRAFPCNGLTFQQWRYWD